MINISGTTLIVIHMQKYWVQSGYDPTRTDSLYYANNKTQDLADRFLEAVQKIRRCGIPVIWVEYDDGRINPLMFEPETNDFTISICRDDAFSSSVLKTHLSKSKIDTVLISGVNYSACVRSSAIGAVRERFNTYVIADLCADGQKIFRKSSPPVKWSHKIPHMTLDAALENLTDYRRPTPPSASRPAPRP
jgi:nicotinamidase-related amidase